MSNVKAMRNSLKAFLKNKSVRVWNEHATRLQTQRKDTCIQA